MMKIVCIGGGKGLASAIKAWQQLNINITAIVATTDNGGCSGRLRDAGSPVPWGDLRKAVFAMASNNHLVDTMTHRYASLGGLNGHCLGNLVLEACFQQSGSVIAAINMFAKQLGVNGHVLPMSEQTVDLEAITISGCRVVGEKDIDGLSTMPATLQLSKHISVPQSCIKAILQADMICIGPGSLLTSVMPVLLAPQIKRALRQSSAFKLFVHNIERECGPAGKLNPNQTVEWLTRQLGENLFSGQLTRTHLLVGAISRRLPAALQSLPDPVNKRHDSTSLANAFAFISMQQNDCFRQQQSDSSSVFRTIFSERLSQCTFKAGYV
ncbi:gluconeogenesis factor YvcK family protein [Aestuariibacter salexigens]|uniref:gluconeogenesis factor YvcK family protein n=1 Tax=Aestuariibacter salexigens TaxID=226010 RepID=UPI00068863E1|nr:uridine diphosphate-N-acetylglucosamine-binding protein YvcK [Aestuariibacter salexigens]